MSNKFAPIIKTVIFSLIIIFLGIITISIATNTSLTIDTKKIIKTDLFASNSDSSTQQYENYMNISLYL